MKLKLIRPLLFVSLLNCLGATAATVQISIGDNFFSPASQTINVGDTVVWVNNGFLAHTVTSTGSPFVLNSGNLFHGASYTNTFTSAGTFNYTCLNHFNQNGAITVQAANQPPTVSITSPTNGMTVLAGSTQTIQATAADSDGTVTKVEFYANAQLIGTVVNAPFNLMTTVPAGNFALTAIAYDNSGATTTSAAVNIQSLTNATLVLDPALPGQPAFRITNAVAGQTYFIDALTNFTGPFSAHWFPIATNTAPSGSFTFSDAVLPAAVSRLYRVRQAY